MIPARDAYGNPGLVDISFDTVFHTEALLKIRSTVDPDNDIVEWNEYNNTALRSLYIGDVGLPGSIRISAYALGSYYPMAWVSSGGSAWYESDGDSLEQLSGTPAYISLIENGSVSDTVYLNDNGFFGYSFRTPLDTGEYHIQIVVTDFTLTDTALVPFYVTSYPDSGETPLDGPNLVIDFSLSGFPLNTCVNNILTMDNGMVYNIGNTTSEPCRAAILHGDDTLLSSSVPALESGESYLMSATAIDISHSESGNYFIFGIADYENEVEEISETDNYKVQNYQVWCCPEDLSPTAIALGGVAYKGIPISISARICNLGGIPADDFDLVMVDSTSSGNDTIAIMENLSLAGFGAYTWVCVPAHIFSDTGWHELKTTVDPGNNITECSEDNNIFSRHVYVSLAPDPDLVIQSEWIVPSDLYPPLGDTFYILNTEVYNEGDMSAYDVEVLFLIDSDTLGEIIVIDSIPNYGTNNHHPCQPSESVLVETCEPPTHIIRVCADPFNKIKEKDTLNNCGTRSVIFCASPDLYIEEIFFESPCAGIGQTTNISALIGNMGNVTASSTLEFYYFDNAGNGWLDTVFIDSTRIEGIEPLTDTAMVSIPWEVVLDPTYIYIKITNSYPPEQFTGNNDALALFSPCRPGDADGSGNLNMLDILYLIAYLYKAGPPPIPYEICSGDPDCDCEVKMLDILYLISYLYKGGLALCTCEDWLSTCGPPLRLEE
jgi:hypothetical protein